MSEPIAWPNLTTTEPDPTAEETPHGRRRHHRRIQEQPARPPDRAPGPRLRPGPPSLQQHDRPLPATHRPLRGRGRRDRRGALRPRARPVARDPRGRPQRPRARHLRRWAGDRPLRDAQGAGRSCRAHRACRGRLYLGRHGPREPRLRPGGAERHHLHHRGGGPHPGRGQRLPQPPLWADHRQPARGRCGAGRRAPGHRQRHPE